LKIDLETDERKGIKKGIENNEREEKFS